MARGTYVDSFSTSICDLTEKQQKDPALVLREFIKHGRFSTFDVTDNQVIAKTTDFLCKNGYVETDHRAYGYPWTKVNITEKGRQLLEDNGYFASSGEAK